MFVDVLKKKLNEIPGQGTNYFYEFEGMMEIMKGLL